MKFAMVTGLSVSMLCSVPGVSSAQIPKERGQNARFPCAAVKTALARVKTHEDLVAVYRAAGYTTSEARTSVDEQKDKNLAVVLAGLRQNLAEEEGCK